MSTPILGVFFEQKVDRNQHFIICAVLHEKLTNAVQLLFDPYAGLGLLDVFEALRSRLWFPPVICR